MRFGEKIVVFILRPIYRTFFERLIWWYLTKIRAFFMAEMNALASRQGAQISECLQKLEKIESGQQQRWAAIEERLRASEANSAGQWDALEQLLLAMFRQPESQTSRSDWKTVTPQESPVSTGVDLNRVHAAGSIR
jgi:hypothetical protein